MATSATSGNKQWAREYPELGTGPVPIEPCISPQYFELERERIFRRVWLNVGRAEEIPKAGDYFVQDLTVCKTSILVLRGRDGQVRGFHNMCSHRGNKLVWDRKGVCRGRMTCKFHGWSYNTEGRLVGVPDEGNFFNLKKEEHGLTPVATDVWEGFIFINLDPQPEETLPEYLGEVTEQMKGYPFDRLTTCYTYKADERVNWKVLLDAQQEGYHLPTLHRRTFVKSFESEAKASPFRSLAVKLYRRHRLLSAGGSPAYRPTPVEVLAGRFGATTLGSMAGALSTGEERGPLLGSFDFYVIFPNFVVALMYGTYFTYNIWPLAVDRTLWEVRMYYPLALNAGQLFSQEYSKCTLRDPLLEDGSTHENTQAMLASGAKTHFILQDEEVMIRHAHKVVEDHVGFSSKEA